jgi:hypothetical protein
MLARIPFGVYTRHRAWFTRLVRVTDVLRGETIPNNRLWFAGLHNGNISAPILTHIIGDGSLHLGSTARIDDAAAAARMNAKLAAVDATIRIVDGQLVNTEFVNRVRDVMAPGSFELMITPSDLTLELSVPSNASTKMNVIATDVEMKESIALGAIEVAGSAVRAYSISLQPFMQHFGSGRRTRFTLECDQPVRVISASTPISP